MGKDCFSTFKECNPKKFKLFRNVILKSCILAKIHFMIERQLSEIISQKLFAGKAIILIGPRQVGKTTILRELIGNRQDAIWMNGDESDIQTLFENISSSRLNALFADKKIVVIDEAQRIENIGLKLKLEPQKK